MTDRPGPAPDVTPGQALFLTGLGRAARGAARRARGGASPETVARLARDGITAATYPDAAMPGEDAANLLRWVLSQPPAPDVAPRPEPPALAADLTERERQRLAAVGKGLFALLRDLERHAGDKPRIGRNLRLRDAIVSLGQDPYLGMAMRDVERFDPGARPPMVRAQVLGFFGPYGALPLNWSEEVLTWFHNGDESFVAFADIFVARFIELYFRAWSDARAITQYDHPTDDRFQTFLLSTLGSGTPAMRDRDAVNDTVKLRFAGLAGAQARSAARLEQMLRLHFGQLARLRVEELVPTWLEFEATALCHVGQQGASLGRDMYLGARVQTVTEKIRIHIEVPDIATYYRFLPAGDAHAQLHGLAFWYLGLALEIDMALWLPQPEVPPAILSEGAQLGWMACVAPGKGDPDTLVLATAFTLAPPVPRRPPQDISSTSAA